MASYSFDAESAAVARNKTLNLNPNYTCGPFKRSLFHLTRKAQGVSCLAVGYSKDGARVGVLVDRNKVTDRASGGSQHRWAYAIPVANGFGVHLFSATWGIGTVHTRERSQACGFRRKDALHELPVIAEQAYLSRRIADRIAQPEHRTLQLLEQRHRRPAVGSVRCRSPHPHGLRGYPAYVLSFHIVGGIG